MRTVCIIGLIFYAAMNLAVAANFRGQEVLVTTRAVVWEAVTTTLAVWAVLVVATS